MRISQWVTLDNMRIDTVLFGCLVYQKNPSQQELCSVGRRILNVDPVGYDSKITIRIFT